MVLCGAGLLAFVANAQESGRKVVARKRAKRRVDSGRR